MTKQDAIDYYGSQAALARALGIHRAAVHAWEEIPVGRQYQIEVLTGGDLKADLAFQQPAPMRRVANA
jgi:hypothetical protein